MAIAAGTRAPNFTLYNTEKKPVTLSDFEGSTIILHFFPAAFSGVCTEQVCASRDDHAFYSEIGATVFGVSIDTPYSLKEFKSKNSITFEFLSDFNKQVIHEYDMYQCNFSFGFRGVAKRGVVVIDATGVVVYSEETANPGVQVNFAALKEAISKLK